MAWTVAFSPGLRALGNGRPFVASEEDANDSDKSFSHSDLAIDANVQAETKRIDPEGVILLDACRIEYAATATAGSRIPTFQLQDAGSDVVFEYVLAESLVTANQTRNINCAVGSPVPTAPIEGDDVVQSFPANFFLFPGFTLRIFDKAAVAAGADDMTLHLFGRVA